MIERSKPYKALANSQSKPVTSLSQCDPPGIWETHGKLRVYEGCRCARLTRVRFARKRETVNMRGTLLL